MSRIIQRVKEIWVHFCPDLDVVASIALILLYGQDQFPGLEYKTKVVLVPAGPLPKDLTKGRTEEQLVADGILVLDTGFGRWDHHVNDNGDKCTFNLVAEALGLDKEPWLQRVISFVRAQDLEGKNVGINGDESSLLLTNIIRGIHLLHQGCISEPSKAFWLLVLVMMGELKAAENFSEFSRGVKMLENSPSIRHNPNQLWVYDAEDAYMRHLWESYCNGQGDCPKNLSEVIEKIKNKQDKASIETLSRDKLYRIMTGKGCCSTSPENSLFTIFGVSFGLAQYGMKYESRIIFLEYLFSALAEIENDRIKANAAYNNKQHCRINRFKKGQNWGIVIGGIISDTYAAQGAIRRKHSQSLIVCFRPVLKQVQVFTVNNGWWRARLHQIAVALRAAELLNRGEAFELADIDVKGECLKCLEWYSGVVTSNGTWANPLPPKTKLNYAQIMRIVQNVVKFGAVPPVNVLDAMLKAGEKEQTWPEGNDPIDWSDAR